MKYLKLFEEISKTFSNLHYELDKFLRKFEKISNSDYSIVSPFYERGERKGIAIAFQYNDKRFSSRIKIFTIRISEASDNKMKELLVKPKLKVKITYYEIPGRVEIPDEDFAITLFEFICEVFKKYSYFNKTNNYYQIKVGEFFLNITEIPNIMTELNENFELYTSTKKYNL